MALHALGWGLWLLFVEQSPMHTAFFRAIHDIGGYRIWTIISLSIGLIQLGALYPQFREFRMVAAFLGFCFWFFAAVSFVIMGYRLLIVPTGIVNLLGCFAIMVLPPDLVPPTNNGVKRTSE